MYFGVDYHPELWTYPYAGTAESPEARWKEDAHLMSEAGVNVVRMGEFAWGLLEPEEGKFQFDWLRRAMDTFADVGIQTVLATPTAAPPLWLAQKHPEILPLDEQGLARHAGTRRAYCMNSDVYWDYSKKIISALAGALGKHPKLIAWQIDNGLGAHHTETSFNEESKRDWQAWIKAKYETIERLNDLMGTRSWGQIVSSWEQVPMPMSAPAPHNPALLMDWMRFSSDTIVAYARMQADTLREAAPNIPVTHNLRAFGRQFDYFDLGEVLDFISIDSNPIIQPKSSELACDIDMLRSLKKTAVRAPDGGEGFWVIEQKANNVNWHEVNQLLRPHVLRIFTYQLLSRGATGVLYFYWRQPRIGTEKFYGGILSHGSNPQQRIYQEFKELGQEFKQLAPALDGTKVAAEACILWSHENDWNLRINRQPNKFFSYRDHVQLFYNALHDRNIPVDFARPTEDLSQYKLVIAPSLQILGAGETDLLKLYVQNGGTLLATCNTGLVDEHHIVPDSGFPHNMTDLFGLEVLEFDVLPPEAENHLTVKGGQFNPTHMHAGRLWCDIIEPKGCQVLAAYSKDFYSGRAALTMNTYGNGKAIYFGTVSQQPFYFDLVVWLRQVCNLFPLLKVPDTVEVSMRQKDKRRIYFLLNHQHSHVRIPFFKPMHDLLSGKMLSGNYDMPPYGVLVLDEQLP